MNTLAKILIYSNPIGWVIGTGMLLGVISYRAKEDVKVANKIFFEELD